MKKLALLTVLSLVINMLAIPCVSFAVDTYEYNFITQSGSMTPSYGSGVETTTLSGLGISANSVTDTDSSYIDFNVSDNSDGSYIVTVSYKEFQDGFFNVTYTDVTGTKRVAGTVYISGDSSSDNVFLTPTKQATFVLENVSFAGSADFRIDTICDVNDAKYGFSSTPVYITGVTARSSMDKHNVLPYIESDSAGNIFFDGNIPTFDVTYSEILGVNTSFTANYTVTHIDTELTESVVQTGQRTFEVDANSEVYDTVVLNVDKFGIYKLNITITNDMGLNVNRTIGFSKCVKSDAVNPSFGTNIDFQYMTMEDDVIELARNAGFGIIRDTIVWNNYDTSNVSRRAVYEKKAENFRKVKQSGMEPMAVLGSYNWEKVFAPDPTTGELKADGNVFAYGEYLEGYSTFVENLLNEEIFRDISLYEIANEPNSKAFYDEETGTYVASGYIRGTSNTLTDEQTQVAEMLGKVYAKVAETTQKAVEDSCRKDVKLGVLSLAHPSNKFTEVFSKKTLDYLKDQAVLDKFDAITYHPYENQRIPEVADEYRVKTINDLAATYGGAIAENAWHTEFGLSTSNYNNTTTNVCVDQFSQAEQLVRHYATSKSYNPNDLYVQYNFVDNGARTNNIEANYGIIECNFAENPLAAKASYLAISNMNDKIGFANEYKQLVNTIEYDKNRSVGDMVIRFTNTNIEHKTAYMLWSLSNGVYPAFDDAIYYDMLGNALDEADIISDGKIQLSDSPIYAVIGAEESENVFRVSGKIATGEENVPVSVIVTGQKTLDDFAEEDILYINEGFSGINGAFSFEAPVVANGFVNVYVSAEGCVPQHFCVPVTVSEISMTLVNGLSCVDSIEIKVSDLNNAKVIVKQNGLSVKVPNLIYALYNDKIFVDVYTTVVNELENGKSFEYSLSVPEGKKFTRASIFLWDENNMPMCSQITIGK